jgi:hypothetical protein
MDMSLFLFLLLFLPLSLPLIVEIQFPTVTSELVEEESEVSSSSPSSPDLVRNMRDGRALLRVEIEAVEAKELGADLNESKLEDGASEAMESSRVTTTAMTSPGGSGSTSMTEGSGSCTTSGTGVVPPSPVSSSSAGRT